MSLQSTILSRQYELMLEGSFSDFTIVVGNREFRVHRFILANRSPVFRAIFETPMLEYKNNAMTIDDVEDDVFQLFLEHVYTGASADGNALKTNAHELILCASKYQVTDLEKTCVLSMIDGMTVENVAGCLMIGSMLRNHELLDAAFQFASGKWRAVKKSEIWPKLAEDHELATRIEMSTMRVIFEMETQSVGNITIDDSPNCEVIFTANCCKLPKDNGAFKFSPSFGCPRNSGFGPKVEWKFKIVREALDVVSVFLVYVGTGDVPAQISCYFMVELKQTSCYAANHMQLGALDSSLVLNRVQKLLSIKSPYLTATRLGRQDNSYYYGGSSYGNTDNNSFLFRAVLQNSNSTYGYGTTLLVNSVVRELFVSPKGAAAMVKVVIGGTTFKILRRFFSSAFSVLDNASTNETTVEIDCVTAATFQKMLDFVFQSNGDCSEFEIEDFLRAAYRLGLREKFFAHLRATIRRKINPNNVMPLLVFAYQENYDKLKADCLEFVYFNLQTLTSLPTWNLISGIPSIHRELLEMIFTKNIFLK